MTKLEALKELLAKVEASDELFLNTSFAEVFGGFSQPNEGAAWSALNAFNGSLDAAKELHDVALGFDWTVSNFSLGGDIEIEKNRPIEREEGYCDCNPARAWLICILKALIAKEQEA